MYVPTFQLCRRIATVAYILIHPRMFEGEVRSDPIWRNSYNFSTISNFYYLWRIFRADLPANLSNNLPAGRHYYFHVSRN